MSLRLEDGTSAKFSQLLSSNVQNGEGVAISFTQDETDPNQYVAINPFSDETARSEVFSFTLPSDPVVTVGRRVVETGPT